MQICPRSMSWSRQVSTEDSLPTLCWSRQQSTEEGRPPSSTEESPSESDDSRSVPGSNSSKQAITASLYDLLEGPDRSAAPAPAPEPAEDTLQMPVMIDV